MKTQTPEHVYRAEQAKQARELLLTWTVRWVWVADDPRMSYWRLQMGQPGRRYVDLYKRDVVAVAIERAEASARNKRPISLRIYGKNGQIQEERTYPRSADPRRSKG